MPDLADGEFIKKIRGGEIHYFSHLVHKYTKVIEGYIMSKLFDKLETDDLVQTTFLQFYKNLDHFDINKPVLPYLYQIAKNELKMYFRSKKQTASLDEEIKIVPMIDPLREGESIEDILQPLNEEQKKALQLVYEGYSYEEISQKLQRPVNTVKTIIRRSRLILKKQHGKT